MQEPNDHRRDLDLRLGKLLRYGRARANLSLDLYNLFNKATASAASGVSSLNQYQHER